MNSLTVFGQRYGPEGWPALLRQELPELTDADIKWLSELSEEMEQFEPPTLIAVMDSMDADEQNLQGNARSTKRRYSARIANRDARAQPQETVARPVNALNIPPRTVRKRKSHIPSQIDCRSTRQRKARPSASGEALANSSDQAELVYPDTEVVNDQRASRLDQSAGSELARGLKPRGASHRPDPMLMSTSLYSTPTASSGAALVGANDREAPHTHSVTTQREREAMLHHTPDLSALDDSSLDDSERASAASTIPMLTTLLSFWLARRADRPRQRGRKARDLRRGTAHGQLVHFLSSGIESGEHHRQPRRHGSRCTRALMKTLGRSKWLNGLCRCLPGGCTDGTGPRPSIEP